MDSTVLRRIRVIHDDYGPIVEDSDGRQRRPLAGYGKRNRTCALDQVAPNGMKLRQPQPFGVAVARILLAVHDVDVAAESVGCDRRDVAAQLIDAGKPA